MKPKVALFVCKRKKEVGNVDVLVEVYKKN